MVTATLAACTGGGAAPGASAVECFLEPANHRRLDRRGRGTHKLAHLFELGHNSLALYPELLRELVNPDLRHYAPLLGPSHGAIKTGSSADPAHRVLRAGLSSCRSSPCAHRALIASRPAFRTGSPSCPACFPPPRTVPPRRRRSCYDPASARERYEASGAVSSVPETRSARENTRRRCASSKHARQGCRYAPRPGCRAWGSGTMPSPAATRRSMLDFATRALQPTQERMGIFPGSGSSARAVITF